MCNGHQILSPVHKATVLPIIGNSLRVGCLYCAEGTKQGARCTCLCCGNCLVCPNTGKGVAFLPQFSASAVKFSLIKEIVINPKSLSPLKVSSSVRAVSRRQNYWICLERPLKRALMANYAAAYCTENTPCFNQYFLRLFCVMQSNML